MKWLLRLLGPKVRANARKIVGRPAVDATAGVDEPYPLLSNALSVFPVLEADCEGDMDEFLPEIIERQPDYLIRLRSEFDAAVNDPSFSWLAAIGTDYLTPFPFDDEEGARPYAIHFITSRMLNDR